MQKTPSTPKTLLAEVLKEQPDYKEALMQVLDFVKTKKRRGLPYYTPEYGTKAKELIDKLLKDRIPIKITRQGDGSINTIRQKFYQGAQYLREVIDKEYVKILQDIKCQTFDDYMEIHIKRKQSSTTGVSTPWREELINFLETEQQIGAKFHKANILLSEDEVTWIIQQLTPLNELFIFQVDTNEILIIRYEEEKVIETN